MAYELPPLPYAHDALQPVLNARTLEIHHGKHHQAYVTNLNKAVEGHPELAAKPVERLIAEIMSVPESIRTAVRNHGGGVANHTLFWLTMGPKKGGEPKGDLLGAIKKDFGGFSAFKEKFTTAATTHFGSGWAWLSVGDDGKLSVCSTLNQDSPVMKGIAQVPGKPILTLDVWEHAYYLDYQNRRPDWIQAWWSVVNWDKVSELYGAARG